MRRLKFEITEEEYENYSGTTGNKKNDFIISKLPVSITCGYGYYGGSFVKCDDKFYIEIIAGDSCD